jgi:imidazolonepropionase-like amidohydrolase
MSERSDGERLIVRGGALIDGSGRPPRPNVTVVIEDDRISSVVSGEIDVPAGSRVVEAAGLTILPGLIDMHVHSRPWAWPLFLRFGVTTVRDLASDPDVVLKAREDERAGRLTAPRIFAAGPLLDGIPPIWGTEWRGSLGLGSTEEARAAAERLIDQGVDWLKVYAGLPEEATRAVAELANARGVPVAGHVGTVSAQQAVAMGLRTIEHASGIRLVVPPAEIEASAGIFTGPSAWLDPTMLVVANIANLPTIGNADYPNLDLVADDPRARWLDWRNSPRFREMTAETFEHLTRRVTGHALLVKTVHDLGGNLLVGTDTPNPFVIPGVSIHQEMALMVAAGVPPLSVIRAATSVAADVLAQPNLGRVAVGALADLVLVAGDPARDITATRNIRKVVKGGAIVHAA